MSRFSPGSVTKKASSARCCPGASAEDIVIMKAFAARPKDWIDVEGIVIRQGCVLDWAYVLRQLEPLADLKEEPEILSRLADLRSRLAGPN